MRILGGVVLSMVSTGLGMFLVDYLFVESLGTTYPELSSMRRECKHSLQHNQECVASIVFLPTAIEE